MLFGITASVAQLYMCICVCVCCTLKPTKHHCCVWHILKTINSIAHTLRHKDTRINNVCMCRIQLYTSVHECTRKEEREREREHQAHLLVVRGWASATAVLSVSDTLQQCLYQKEPAESLTTALMSVLSGLGQLSAWAVMETCFLTSQKALGPPKVALGIKNAFSINTQTQKIHYCSVCTKNHIIFI